MPRPPALVSAFALALAVGCSKPAPPPEAPRDRAHFVENDLAAARAQARREKKLVFVDAWAPWCHTCLSLKEYVLSDPALAKLSDRFVFASIDTEREDSEPFVKTYAMRFWPTLWVLDPDSGEAIMKWPGSLTTPELVALLEGVAKDRGAGAAMGDLVRADRALAAGKLDDAVAAYDAARGAAPKGSAAHGRATDALVTALSEKDPGRCVEVAEAEVRALPRGTHAVNVAVVGLDCMGKAKRDSAVLREVAEAFSKDRALPLLDDDRSGLFEALVEAADHDHDDAKKRALATAWASFLEERAAAAPSKKARVVFDAHRLLAYLALDRLADARTMLEASEKDFPDDANIPARLMRVYRAEKQLDLAEAAGRRAMGKIYGPRTLSVAEGLAAVLRDKGDAAGERKVIEEALARVGTRELTSGNAKIAARLKARLDGAEPTHKRR